MTSSAPLYYEDNWQILVVDLVPSLNQTFQLFLEARIGRSYLSDLALDDLELLAGEDCRHLRSSNPPPQPWQGEKLLSPGSCQGRCGQNITLLSLEWEEGGCDCQDSSPPNLSCQDFSVICRPPDTTEAEAKTGRLWGDTVAWTTPMIVVIVSSCLLLLLLVTIRLRAVKHHGDTEEDREEAERIIEDEEEEEEEVMVAHNKRTSDVEEFIDFTLATACELDTVNNTQRYETIMSLSNRKITSL